MPLGDSQSNWQEMNEITQNHKHYDGDSFLAL